MEDTLGKMRDQLACRNCQKQHCRSSGAEIEVYNFHRVIDFERIEWQTKNCELYAALAENPSITFFGVVFKMQERAFFGLCGYCLETEPHYDRAYTKTCGYCGIVGHVRQPIHRRTCLYKLSQTKKRWNGA